jgi:hypothetical protein
MFDIFKMLDFYKSPSKESKNRYKIKREMIFCFLISFLK